MYYSRTEWVEADTVDQEFAISYDYLDKTHLSYFLRTDATDPATETAYLGSVIYVDKQNVILPDITVKSFLQVRRTSPKDETTLQFIQSNPVLPADASYLNLNTFFCLQEICDNLLDAGITSPPPPPSLNNFYEVQLGGSFASGSGAGPVVMGRASTLPASGLVFRASVITPPPDEDEVLNIQKNGINVGTITVTTGAVVTVDIPVDVDLVLGDALRLIPAAPKGMRDFGIVFILNRTT